MPRRASIRLLLTAAVAGALATMSVTTPRAQSPASSADIPDLPFEKYTLPNGLEVILSQNTRLPMVSVNLWYHVGPVNEEPGRTGFAHLFEHMMFQSSKHVPEDSHIRLLEAAGASDLNGTTSHDRTNYFETVPANQLELALWLESDRMGYLLEKVDQAALSNQQDVVRNERRQSVENRPYGLAEEMLVQTVFPQGHPYYGDVIRIARRHPGGETGGREQILPPVLRAEQRELGDCRGLRTRTHEGAGREILRHAQAWPGCPVCGDRDTADHRRASAGGHGARGAPAGLHGLVVAADFRAWRCRRGYCRRHSRFRTVESPLQKARI